MSDDLFKRPRPPPPPPFDEWLDDATDRADNQRTPFFVGREREYEVFCRGATALSRGRVGGQAIILQGAPGAGKSALMQECIAAVEAHSTRGEPWVAVVAPAEALAHPAEVAAEIVRAVRVERARWAPDGLAGQVARAFDTALAELAARGGGLFGLRVGAERRPSAVGAQAAFEVASGACDGARVVMFVDEAQNAPDVEGTRGTLDVTCRGFAKMDLLPVFVGLGDTADVLDARGVSRPPGGRVVELGALSVAEVRASLDMEFDAFGVRGRARDQWRDALAELAQGWPQHLHRVRQVAGMVLRAHGKDCDAAPLEQALAAGRRANQDYCGRRVRPISTAGRAPLPELGARLRGAGATLADHEVRAVLGASGIAGDERQDAWLLEAVHRGVLARVGADGGRYRIPIPSLAAYLAELDVAPPSPRRAEPAPAP